MMKGHPSTRRIVQNVTRGAALPLALALLLALLALWAASTPRHARTLTGPRRPAII